ncbi:MAG TPA: hypothetical protein VEZ70_09235 [Allosphingosinicella sp.]|nr:hypothetical protein [Allosphingosinicella sp.]
MKIRTILLAFLIGLAPPALAQEPPPERTTSIVVYGDDPCPKASEEEIVVCARRPENDRYRIPKDLRNTGDPPSEVSWGARTELLEDAARTNLPGSCSVVGSYGQSGCQRQFVDQWYRDRRARRVD